ncbi:MAG: beta-lactamase family protein, partial [Firmicutes bacterium]|nr:beta-lactamase family protein [Bacillota bacterium]
LTYEPETIKVKSLEETGAVGGSDLAFAEKAYRKMTEKRGNGTAISFALIKEGEVVAAAATGTRAGDPKDPVTTRDLFNIGSTSKVYCTMAIMKLVEMGKVELDAPVCRYIPGFKMDDPRYRDITVRHCLNHSSGLPGTNYSMGFMTKFCDREVFNASYLDYISKCRLKADPGNYSVYCNDGFIVAQLVVEYVTGMSLTTFLQKYILGPIGCVSTCSGENNPDNRVLVHMPDRAPEKIMIVGTGGISTDMTDCARFGWACVEPGKAFSAASVAETAEHQHTAWELEGYESPYGLGWDDVALRVAGFDLGEGCLIKGGTTLQFHSHLIVSRDRRLVGALSATADIGIDTIGFLSELMADYEGVEYKAAEQPEKQPIPEGYAEKFSGVYYGSMTTDEYLINENGLTHRLLMNGADPIEVVKDAPFVGNGFWVEGALLSFIEGPDGTCYMLRQMMADLNTYVGAEKALPQPPINDSWLARDGRVYFNISANAYDVIVAGMFGTTRIVCAKDENVIKFIEHGKLAPYAEMHAISETGDTTGLFKKAPGMGSRDTFAPFTWREGGFEHLYMYGYEFIEEAGIGTVEAGELAVPAGTCRPYRIADGKKFAVCQGGARLIVLDKGQNVVADTMDTGDVKEVTEGYILVLTDGAATLKFTEA